MKRDHPSLGRVPWILGICSAPPRDWGAKYWIVSGTRGSRSTHQTQLIVPTRVPAILNDSLWFACQRGDISMNIASLSFGLATMDYPLSWWLAIITSFIGRWCLQGIIAFKAVRQWAVRGSAYRLKEGSMARDV